MAIESIGVSNTYKASKRTVSRRSNVDTIFETHRNFLLLTALVATIYVASTIL